MQELEKILEEIDAEIEKERAMCEDIEDTPGWRLYEKTMNIAKGIIHRHIDGKDSNVPTNDGWIPVDERLPEEKINPASRDFYEYQVTAKFGNVKDVRHYKYGNGHWWHGFCNVDKYVTAWRESPEPYRPEKEQERKEDIRGGR